MTSPSSLQAPLSPPLSTKSCFVTSLSLVSQFPTLTQVADETAFTSVDVDVGGSATTDIGLDAGQGSGTIHKTPTRPHDSPLPRVHTLGSDEGNMEYYFDVNTAEGFTTASVHVTTTGIEISTANISVSTASVTPKKKSKKQLEQERLGHEEAIRLQEQINEEERQRIARDAEISDLIVLRYHAVQNRSFSIAEVRKNMCIYLKNQEGYKQSHFKGMKYKDIRPIFKRVWDQNHAFIPKDSEIKKEVMKRSGFDLQQESSKQVEEEIVQQDDVVAEKVVKESSRKAKGRLKRKTSKARKDKDKRQKNQDDPEKLTLMKYVVVISDSKEVINVIPLAVKSLIVSWTSYCKEDVGYYEIHRADGSYKPYIFFSEMLIDFDREDLIMLYILFNEKYASTRPGFDDLMLWGDMKIMFEPDDDDAA
ncbi:hypothetical protein Tco_0697144 [Tanacetum coccineum]